MPHCVFEHRAARTKSREVSASAKGRELHSCGGVCAALTRHGDVLSTASSELWRVAEEFGGVCHRDLTPEVTHVVANKVSAEYTSHKG